MTKPPRDPLWLPKKLFSRLATLIAIICCLILIAAACVGVIRGYSVLSESLTLFYLILVIMFLLIPYQAMNNSKIFFIRFCWSVAYFFMFIGCLQGRHYIKGFKFYYQGEYDKAAMEFEKETGLWYLKLSSNSSEHSAMEMLAESYCQLEEYDKAIDAYKTIVFRYQGLKRKVASSRLQRLKDGLQSIARYKEENQELQNDFRKLYDIADVYESDLNCNTKALAIYRTITEMNIPAKDKRNAYDAVLRLTPVKNNNH